MQARELKNTTIYRVVSQDEWSRTDGAWWMEINPMSITGAYWRMKFAVLNTFSTNGKYVKLVVKDKPLRVWEAPRVRILVASIEPGCS